MLGCIIGLPLVLYGGWSMVLVGLCCVLFCFLYTTKLSYLGLGDLLVLIFFGIVPVCCTYYVIMPGEQQTVTLEVFVVSIASGLVIDTLLIVNNYRDRENDRRAGKITLVVRIGEKVTEWLYLTIGIVATIICIAIGKWEDNFLYCGGLYAIYPILHIYTCTMMHRINHGRELNKILGSTARNMFIFGLTNAICIISRVN